MWFSRDAEVDATARTFAPLIRAAGRSGLAGDEWMARDGLVAQLILLDQLSRNAFRGEDEAFAYDDRAAAIALELIAATGDAPHALPPSHALWIVTALMHSEDVALHERVENWAAAHVRASASAVLRRQLERDLPQHTAVLRRFGRYPHRNRVRGRETTADEAEWLASDDCPGWARSQQPARRGGEGAG